jgi:hypothetical protein
MIPLEKQVVNLELSKRLKKLGVRQESLFDWGKYAYGDEIKVVPTFGYQEHPYSYICSAFTVAELGEMLPIEIEGGEKGRGISKKGISPKGYNGKLCTMT